MADMNKLEMLNAVRYLLDERLDNGVNDGIWSNTQLMFQIDQAMWQAYFSQINADMTSFLVTATIEGDGSEAYDRPANFVKPHRLMVTSEMSNRTFCPYHPISLMDRQNGTNQSQGSRVFWMAPSDQIGILPVPSVDLTLEYYKQFAELDKEGVIHSDLHPVAQYLAVLYAAFTASISRGEKFTRGISALIVQQETLLHNIRPESPEPFQVVPSRSYSGGRPDFSYDRRG